MCQTQRSDPFQACFAKELREGCASCVALIWLGRQRALLIPQPIHVPSLLRITPLIYELLSMCAIEGHHGHSSATAAGPAMPSHSPMARSSAAALSRISSYSPAGSATVEC